MAEEEHYDDVDISDIIDESEHYLEADHQHAELAEPTDSENLNTIPDSDLLSSEEHTVDEKRPQVQNKTEVIRSTRLPIARIKNIMKMDPDVSVVSGDAVFLVTKATELFLETIAKETYAYTATNKRKIIAKKDLDLVINKVDCLCFLEETSMLKVNKTLQTLSSTDVTEVVITELNSEGEFLNLVCCNQNRNQMRRQKRDVLTAGLIK